MRLCVDVLAPVTGLSRNTLAHLGHGKGRRRSPAVALCIARAAGMSVETIISGPTLSEAGRCKAFT